MTIHAIPVPHGLAHLARVYAAAGHQLWFVGGCVRDHLMGIPCKDVDLATSATPLEQVAVCDASGHRWIGTGLQHGTVTVLAGEPYEITTFRTDLETDGRHAVVGWARDVSTDLARRDLTVNAIAMSLDGRIVDPFGGARDCAERRIRFVGDAAARIGEDHLRILRWFRFLGRFGPEAVHDEGDLEAIGANAASLRSISVERIWSEVSRILTGPQAARIAGMMHDAGVLEAIGVRHGDDDLLAAAAAVSGDPAFILAAWQGRTAIGLLDAWNASNAEQATAHFVAERLAPDAKPYGLDAAKRDLVDGFDRTEACALLRMTGAEADARILKDWTVPSMPVRGADLIASGMTPGRAVGERLASLRETWIASGYALGRDELLSDAVPA